MRPQPWKSALTIIALLAGGLVLCGCGTTRSTDTSRTATEQLLISDAIDRAVQTVNFGPLTGQTVYLDDHLLGDVVDKQYLISTLRQHLLASGCDLRDKVDEAEFVVEARAGAIGTDRNDLLFGLPSMNVPQIMPLQPVPAAIPEIPIAKRRDQRGIAKIAVFAYQKKTGIPVWQSGMLHEESSANDVWILGAGPFQHGTIYGGTEFAGNTLPKELNKTPRRLPPSVAQERTFNLPSQLVKQGAPQAKEEPAVVQAEHQEPVTASPAPTVAKAEPAQHAATPVAGAAGEARAGQSVASQPPADGGKDAGVKMRASGEPRIRQADAKTAQLTGPATYPSEPLPQPRFNSP